MKAYRPVCGLLLLSAILVVVVAALSVRLPDDKNWIDLVQAMGTPSVALLAAYFTWKNYQLTRAKRQDELFDRRFAFYSDLTKQLFDKINETSCDDENFTREEFSNLLDEWAAKSVFLFPSDVPQDLRKLKAFDFHAWIARYDMSERPIDEIFVKHMRYRP